MRFDLEISLQGGRAVTNGTGRQVFNSYIYKINRTMNLREVKLKSGKIVTIERFEMTFTYDGLLLGKPDKELNNIIIQSIKDNHKDSIFLLILDDAFISEEQLKPFIFSATLTSKPIDKKNDFSALDKVWFGDDIKNLSISELVMNIKKFNWSELAQDFEY